MKEIFMGIGSLLKGKALMVVLASVIVAGGATAMAAATPVGQRVVHTITGLASARATPVGRHTGHTVTASRSATTTPDAKSQQNSCPGLPDAQQLATTFSLSTDSTSDDIQAICSLHLGSFKGTTPAGATATSSRVFGYGEISDLLTYAQYLATHGKANADGKLTSSNTRSYLAEVLQNCGIMAGAINRYLSPRQGPPTETCLKTHIPGFQPGNGEGTGNGGGKPGSAPTPGGGKPTSTPTPHH